MHSRGKTLSKDVDFEKIARRTPGNADSSSVVPGWHLAVFTLKYTPDIFSEIGISLFTVLTRCCAFAAGFTGADIQNLMNEAAILAARRNLKEVSKEEIADALERIVAGPEKKGAVVSEPKKRLVAYHEVRCLALTAALSFEWHVGAVCGMLHQYQE